MFTWENQDAANPRSEELFVVLSGGTEPHSLNLSVLRETTNINAKKKLNWSPLLLNTLIILVGFILLTHMVNNSIKLILEI